MPLALSGPRGGGVKPYLAAPWPRQKPYLAAPIRTQPYLYPFPPTRLHPLVNVACRRCVPKGGDLGEIPKKFLRNRMGSLGTAPVRGKLKDHGEGGVIS